MELQADRYPSLKIPWIESSLISLIIENNGEQTEGIFRIASDPDHLHTGAFRRRRDCNPNPPILGIVQMNIWVRPAVKDAHIPAALLKQWLRQLPTPLIPREFYDRCLAATTQPDLCCSLVSLIPTINRRVLAALIGLLQRFCDEETVK